MCVNTSPKPVRECKIIFSLSLAGGEKENKRPTARVRVLLVLPSAPLFSNKTREKKLTVRLWLHYIFHCIQTLFWFCNCRSFLSYRSRTNRRRPCCVSNHKARLQWPHIQARVKLFKIGSRIVDSNARV